MEYNVKAIIKNTSSKTIQSGYRPAHKINGYLTTGVHKYIDTDKIDIGDSTIGYITFITPGLYIDFINEGEIIDFFDGSKKVGYAKIMEVYRA